MINRGKGLEKRWTSCSLFYSLAPGEIPFYIHSAAIDYFQLPSTVSAIPRPPSKADLDQETIFQLPGPQGVLRGIAFVRGRFRGKSLEWGSAIVENHEKDIRSLHHIYAPALTATFRPFSAIFFKFGYSAAINDISNSRASCSCSETSLLAFSEPRNSMLISFN